MQVKAYMREKRISSKAFFEDFDRLRTGVVTASIFTRVLSMVGLAPFSSRLAELAQT